MKINNLANEKYSNYQAELCDKLFTALTQLSELESEIFSRYNNGETKIWNEYRDRYYSIIAPICTEKQLKRFHTPSFGMPTQYGYLPDCTVDFIMKSVTRAEIITHYTQSIDKLSRFVLKNIDGEWLIDEVYYGFESDITDGKYKWLITRI